MDHPQDETQDLTGQFSALGIDFSVKHPLQDQWTWWYDNPGGKRTTISSWGTQLKKIYTFETVEDFWRLYNNIKPPQDLPPGSNYHIFKMGIEPRWEDKANTNGGKWVYKAGPGSRNTALKQHWENIILALIGAEFEDSEEIAGISANIRSRGDRIELWTFKASEEKLLRIGQKFKEALGIPNGQVTFQAHSVASTSSKEHSLVV